MSYLNRFLNSTIGLTQASSFSCATRQGNVCSQSRVPPRRSERPGHIFELGFKTSHISLSASPEFISNCMFGMTRHVCRLSSTRHSSDVNLQWLRTSIECVSRLSTSVFRNSCMMLRQRDSLQIRFIQRRPGKQPICDMCMFIPQTYPWSQYHNWTTPQAGMFYSMCNKTGTYQLQVSISNQNFSVPALLVAATITKDCLTFK